MKATTKLKNALQQISSWITANLLTLNSYKTEFLLIGLKIQLAKIHNSSLGTIHSLEILASSLTNILLSLIKLHLSPKPVTITFVDFADSSTACTIATSIVHSKLDYCKSLYYKLPKSQLSRLQQIQNSLAIYSLSLNCHVSSRSRTLLLVLSWKLPSHVISLLSYGLFTGSGSLNASNTSSSHLPTKFSRLPNLHNLISVQRSRSTGFIRCYSCSATVIILFKNNLSLLALCFTLSLESTLFIFRQHHSGTSSCISDSLIPSPITS